MESRLMILHGLISYILLNFLYFQRADSALPSISRIFSAVSLFWPSAAWGQIMRGLGHRTYHYQPVTSSRPDLLRDVPG